MSAPAPSMYSPAAKAMAEKLGLKLGRANLDEFAATLMELAKANPNIVAVTSDSRGSGKLGPFGQALPKQLVEVGIAEQNLVGITAGLAACGKKSFGVSPSCFLTARSLEQIKNDICYSDVPATLIGISSGVSYGALGTTHHSLHDLAVLRAIHNLIVIVPFTPDQAIQIGNGNDFAFLATGETVVHAVLAAGQLESQGLKGRVLSVPTIKPLDTAAILKAGHECRALITVEEHSVHGGLGEACAAVLMQAGIRVPFRIIGMPDEDTITGAQADIFRHYGISMEGLSQSMAALLAAK